jgi:protein-tyrosine phosphatase
MEIFVTEDLASKIRHGKVIPLHESNRYLVEFPFDFPPELMGDILMGMKRSGDTPILAHPERYACLQDYPQFLSEWVANGLYTQINKGSLLGGFGRDVQKTAELFLQHRCITCIASDSHSPKSRTPYLGEIYDYLCRYFSEDTAIELLDVNPGRLLFGDDLKPQTPIPIKKRSWH